MSRFVSPPRECLLIVYTMPYTIRKVPRRNCYSVKKAKTKGKTKGKGRRIFARCTSKAKAKKQVRLLYALDNNPNFIPRK
jgi:hypothetical protein